MKVRELEEGFRRSISGQTLCLLYAPHAVSLRHHILEAELCTLPIAQPQIDLRLLKPFAECEGYSFMQVKTVQMGKYASLSV